MKEHNHETRRICEVHVKIKLLIHFPSQPNASDKIHDVAADSLRLQLEQSLLQYGSTHEVLDIVLMTGRGREASKNGLLQRNPQLPLFLQFEPR